MKKIKFLSIAVLSIAMTFTACKKEPGPQGPAGTNGVNGNANVTVQTFIVTTWNGNSTEYDWYTDFSVTALTSSVQSSGAIQVFFSINNGATWKAIPFTHFDGSVIYSMGFTTMTNNVEVFWNFTGTGMADDPNYLFSTNCQFKVVVIPPVMTKRKDVNWNNYEDIKNTFNLKD